MAKWKHADTNVARFWKYTVLGTGMNAEWHSFEPHAMLCSLNTHTNIEKSLLLLFFCCYECKIYKRGGILWTHRDVCCCSSCLCVIFNNYAFTLRLLVCRFSFTLLQNNNNNKKHAKPIRVVICLKRTMSFSVNIGFRIS